MGQELSNKISDKYEIDRQKPLGKGSFGSVYTGYDKVTNKQVAIKQIFKNNGKMTPEQVRKSYQTEITILNSIKSDHVVSFEDVFEDKFYFYIVMELCDMSLTKFLISNGGKLTESAALQTFTNICTGFFDIYKSGFIHRDLKPDNILVIGHIAKIADFGISTMIERQNFTSNVGTLAYRAPQIQQGSNHYSSKVDIWALGLIFYQMIYGQIPEFTKIRLRKDQANKRQSKRQQFLKILNQTKISQNIKDVIKCCLKQNQDERISWNQLFKHQIFEGDLKKFADNKNKKFQNIQNRFENSTILKYKSDVYKMMKFFTQQIATTQLLFRGSRDSFKAVQFHAKCNNIPNTLTIVETSAGKIIGGFTPCKWNNQDGLNTGDNSQKSFIFQFNNNDKFTLKTEKTKSAICNHPDCGPAFGGGADFIISDEANINSSSNANIGYSYQNDFYIYGDANSQVRFSGTKYFVVKDYQVWKISFENKSFFNFFK